MVWKNIYQKDNVKLIPFLDHVQKYNDFSCVLEKKSFFGFLRDIVTKDIKKTTYNEDFEKTISKRQCKS